MNIKILAGTLFALASAAPALADDVDIQDLADRTGLSERQVKMVLGPQTPYAEYRTSANFAERRVRDALEADVHPAVVVGEVRTTTVPASTVTESTTTTTYPATTDEATTTTGQLRVEPADSSTSNTYYDDESDDDNRIDADSEYDEDDVDDDD
jgi:hypothetical protein